MSKDFTDYLDFNLSFEELKEIVENEEIYKTWHNALSAVAGII